MGKSKVDLSAFEDTTVIDDRSSIVSTVGEDGREKTPSKVETTFKDGADLEIVDFDSIPMVPNTPKTIVDDPDDEIEQQLAGIKDKLKDKVAKGADDTIEDDGEESSEDDVEAATKTAEKKKTGKDAPSEENTSSSPYASFAKVMNEEGVITQFDPKEFEELVEELGSPAKALIELNKRTIDEMVQLRFDNLPADYKQLLTAAEKGVPLKDAFTVQAKLQDISQVTEDDIKTDIEVAKNIIRQSYPLRGFSAAETEQEIKDMEANDRLSTKALSEKTFLQKTYKDEEARQQATATRQKDQAKQRAKQEDEQIVHYAKNISKLLPGVKTSPKLEQKLIQNIKTPVKQGANGVLLNGIWATRDADPIKFDMILSYLYETGVFNGKLDKIKRDAVTDSTKELEQLILSGNSNFTQGTPAGVQGTKKDIKKISESARTVFSPKRIRNI